MPTPFLAPETQWTLEDFAIVANDRLPQVLPNTKPPHTKPNAKLSDAITPRLIRYYTQQGVLDEPIREGKFAFYTPRHLLQLLVCRRLLAEGFTVAVIAAIARHKTDTELEAMLTGGMEFHLTATQTEPPLQPGAKPVSCQWLRLPIREGIELHLRSDITLPQTPLEYQHFLAEVERTLKAWTEGT